MKALLACGHFQALFVSTLLSISSATTTAIAASGPAPAAPLRCRQNNIPSWQIVNSRNQVIGSQQMGFEDQAECQLSITKAHGNLLCSWNGQKMQVYNWTNGVAIGEDPQYQWDDSDQCFNSIASHTPNGAFACGWDGSTARPYTRANNRVIGTSPGWETMDECTEVAENSSVGNLVCGWDGKAEVYGTDGAIVFSDLTSLDDCRALMATIKTYPVPTNITSRLQQGKPNSGISPFRSGTPDGKVGFAWKSCEEKATSYNLTKNQDGVITPECSPDTLYSWGSFEKINWYRQNLKPGKNWSGTLERSLFTVSMPASTFGYGAIPMRFKLKKNTRIKLLKNPSVNTCEGYLNDGSLTQAELKNTIIARYDDSIGNDLSLFEYIVCSSDVIESWSYSTPEHFDEILKDNQWKTTQNYYFWEGYFKKNGVDQYIDADIGDPGVDFSVESFTNRMTALKRFIRSGYGEVISRNPSLTRATHFQTAHPIYFNTEANK